MDENEFEEGCNDLLIVIVELIDIYISRNWKDHLKEVRLNDGDVVAFDCMNDDVSRLWRLVEFHDNLRSEKEVIEDFLLFHKSDSDSDEWDLDDKDVELIESYFNHLNNKKIESEKNDDEWSKKLGCVSDIL